MKSQKGITLTSLIIYVLAMLIVVVVLTRITGYIYKGIGINNENEGFDAKYIKLISYISKEVNTKNNRVFKNIVKNGQEIILFKSGKQITYIEENKAVYYEKVKICEDIDQFTAVVDETTGTLSVTLKQGDIEASNQFTFSK